MAEDAGSGAVEADVEVVVIDSMDRNERPGRMGLVALVIEVSVRHRLDNHQYDSPSRLVGEAMRVGQWAIRYEIGMEA